MNIPESDWIFFSSPNSVNHLLRMHSLGTRKVAALSRGTANALLKFNVAPDFIGNENSDPAAIGAAFKKNLLPNDKVLFPISQRSKKTVIKELEPSNVIELISYDTNLITNLDLNDSYGLVLFTSPSNFEGYLANSSNNDPEIWVAFGNTTAETIRARFPEREIQILDSSSEEGFLELLNTFIA